MTYTQISVGVSDRIMTLTLNRPDQLNAFTVTMGREMIEAFNLASDDDDVSVIVVTGAGKAFCAGMDLSVDGNVFGLDESAYPTLADMRERADDPHMIKAVRDLGGQINLAMYDCKKPIIAAINGVAVGYGATMTCAMDIRLASENAKVGFVFNKVGVTPEACSTWFLPRIVGMQTALEWCYTADIHDAATLQRERFVKAVYPGDELLDEAYKLARKIAQYSQVTNALTRQMMYRNSAAEHPRVAHEVDSLSIYYTSVTSGKEGVQAFREKRAPRFAQKASTDMPDFYPWWQRHET